MADGALVLHSSIADGSLLEQLNTLDDKLHELQAELQSQEHRFKYLHDERYLLEQLQTINQMASRKLNDEVFGDGKLQPSKKLFIEHLPQPEEFAVLVKEVAQRQVAEGAENAESMLEDIESKDALTLLYDEVVQVLESTVKDPKVEMRMDPLTGNFLGCAILACGSLDEGERTLTTLSNRWQLPPHEDQPVQLHYIDEATDPKVLVEGLTPQDDVNVIRDLLSHYGTVEEIETKEIKKGSVTVRFRTIEDAFTAISLQHGRPIPPAVFHVDVESESPDVILGELAAMLNMSEEDIDVVSPPERVEERGANVYSLRISSSHAHPEDIAVLGERRASSGQVQVLSVMPPPSLTLRLPKKRKKIRPEDQEQLVMLEDKLKMEKQKTARLERELHEVLEPELNSKIRAAEKAVAELEAMRAETGWDEKRQISTHTQIDRENRINEALRDLANIKVEQAILRKETIKKTAHIEALAHKLLRKEEIMENYKNMQEELRKKEVELQDRKDDVRTLKRILGKKEKLTDEMASADDSKQIKSLESDKRVLQHEIARHVESRRAAEKTIQAQHHRIVQLTNRINAIAAALHEIRDISQTNPYRPEGATTEIDVRSYERMQNELQEYRKHLMSRDMLMLERDAQIETLEKKVEILAKSKRVNLNRTTQERKHLQTQYDMFNDFRLRQEEEAEEKKAEILRDMAALEAKIAALTTSMGEHA
eukprot:Sspe_Gene.39070::Locus_18858_Transcript_1_1_Confidence_1.000_Length_2340::g.39070::m.39070